MNYKQRYNKAMSKMDVLIKKYTGTIISSDGTLYKDLQNVFPELKETEEKPNGGIVLEDFNEGDGFYKVNLAYLSKEQVEEIESMVKKWHHEPSELDEKIRKELIKETKGSEVRLFETVTNDEFITWLEKQGEQEYTLKSHNDDDDDDDDAKGILAWLEKQSKIISANYYKTCKGGRTSSQANESAWLHLVSDVLTWKDGIGQYLDDPRVQELAKKLCNEYAQKLYNSVQDAPFEQKPIKVNGKSALEAIKEEKVDNANKVEPKFKVGDWVVNKLGDSWHIDSFDKKNYQVSDGKGNYNYFPISKREDMHLWSIVDAKDGDVLCYKDEISLYKHDIKNCTKEETTFGGFVYHCCYDGKRFIMDSLYSLTEQDKMDIHPATKGQCDLLFTKIKKSGYTWDSEKKEVIWI